MPDSGLTTASVTHPQVINEVDVRFFGEPSKRASLFSKFPDARGRRVIFLDIDCDLCASPCQFDKLLELRAWHYGRVSHEVGM